MAEKSQRCSSETDGLILSSFQVLQDSRPQHEDVRHLKLNCSFLNNSEVADSDQNENNHQATTAGHVCITEAAEGDEMFDVTDNDQFRGDEVGDSLDNTTNNSLDREDDGDDEEEDEDDEGGVMRRDGLQGMSSSKTDVTAETSVGKLACPSSVSDLRTHHCPQETFEELNPVLGAHGYLDHTRAVWHSDSASGTGGDRYPADWHMALSSGNGVTTREVLENGVLSGPLSPGESREADVGDQHWKFVHGHGQTSSQHIWGTDQGATKVVVGGPVGQSWTVPKQEVGDDHQHDIQSMHHHGSMDWGQRMRPGQPQMHGWHKDIGVISPEEDMNAVRNLFNLQPAQNGISTPTVNSSFSDLTCSSSGAWTIGRHLPSGPAVGAMPQPMLHHDLTCRRVAPPSFYHQGPTQGYAGFQTQGREGWQQAVMNPGTSGLQVESASELYKLADVQSSMVCKSAILNKRGKGRSTKYNLNVSSSDIPSKARSALDQARQQAHPYQMNEQKKLVRDVYPATSANVHTLKASHIVSWYIDYLIHENEHLTQISRAFSLPVNLFLSDDFYFMDSLKKKVHFPSLKFLSWMQQNLPSINVNAIDFHEGRPPVVSTWNQEWFWQNKSRRDIIHDVFFYFQHRRVTCEN